MSEWKEIVRRKLAGMKIESDIIEELSQYLEDRYEELRAGGVPEIDARRRALEGLDDASALSRELRKAKRVKAAETPNHTGAPLSLAVYDLRMAMRAARGRPGFSFMVIGILALGIAGNALSRTRSW